MMKRRSRETAPPVSMEESRFDQWANEDIYTALEASLMNAQGSLEEFRRVSTPDDKSKVLGVTAIQMETATEALGVLRKRLVVRVPVANDKRNG
jgi:hypothetical protein